MATRRQLIGAVAVLAALAAAAPPPAPPSECAGGYCAIRMTAPELLHASEELVMARRFDEAKPLVAALTNAPELTMERQFLEGYIAVETGDLTEAERKFRAVLAARPDMTRARLELARALMMDGKDKAADYHYRLAQQDRTLPPEVLRTVYSARGIIRDRKTWDLNVDFGLAPDTNINSATADHTVDVLFGNTTLPLTLSQTARKMTGVGQTGSVSGTVRLRVSDGLAMVVDADGNAVNYKGTDSDDISALVAAGPELTFKDGTRVTVQALAGQRWYGGDVASRGAGVRANLTKNIGEASKIALQLDVRHTDSHINRAYDGMQYGAFLSYERVLHQSMIGSLTGFVRREPLRSNAYSNTEFGVIAGLGGELPHGLNAGVSAQVSRAIYDGPMAILSPDARHDWRLQSRLYAGARGVRVLGFSPSATYTFSATRSNVDLYKFSRHRIEFSLARYF